MPKIEAWEFNLEKLDEAYDYMKMTVENQNIFHVVSTGEPVSLDWSSARTELEKLKSMGWEAFYTEEQYSTLGPRYFLGFRKRKPQTKG